MPFAYLKLADGQLLKVLTDDNGIIQQSYNGDPTSFVPLVIPSSGAVESVTGNLVDNTDPLNPVVSQPTVTASVSASHAQTITISGLDGDTDGNYKIVVDLICATNAPGEIYLQINGNQTNQFTSIIYNFAGVGQNVYSGLLVFATASTVRITGTIFLSSKTGNQRSFSSSAKDSGNNQVLAAGTYADTSTNITSLVLTAANANAFDTGSRITVTKLKEL